MSLVVRRVIGDNLAQPVPPVLQRLDAGVAGGDFEGDHAGRELVRDLRQRRAGGERGIRTQPARSSIHCVDARLHAPV